MGRTKWRWQETPTTENSITSPFVFIFFLFSFVQQMNDSLDLLKPAKLVQYRQCTVIQGGLVAVRDLTARNAIVGQLWVRIYIFICIYFLFIFLIEFFEGVGRGGQYRWSMDRSVRWSVDPVRWTGSRTGGQCFRVTPA